MSSIDATNAENLRLAKETADEMLALLNRVWEQGYETAIKEAAIKAAQTSDEDKIYTQKDVTALCELAVAASKSGGKWPIAMRQRADGLGFNPLHFAGEAQPSAISDETVSVPMEWQPIKTVPKDGREVLLCVEMRAGARGGMLVGHYMPGGHCIEDHPPIDEGWYFWDGSRFDKASKPTHWMPLPTAAQEGK